jgi:hypothetical protein
MAWIKYEPFFAVLHGDPRWPAVLTRMNLNGGAST